MRFLHLSTGDTRGAFTGAHRLHEGLQALGHDSDMYVLLKRSNDTRVHSPKGMRRYALSTGLAFYQKIWRRLFTNSVRRGTHYFFPYWDLGGALGLPEVYKKRPDLVIVYYVANFLSAADLLRIQEKYKAPVALYLMDVAMLTGGCHYTWSCEKFKDQCGNCPALRFGHDRDRSRITWQDRNSVYKQMPISSIAASAWLEEKISQSSLMRDRPVYRALLGVDSELFRPKHKLEASADLDLGDLTSKTVIYFGAQDLEEPRKGFSYLLEALKILAVQLSRTLLEDICIFTVGGNRPQLDAAFEHKHIEYISDKKKFAQTYNVADVFICSSVEDAGPMMINESMMSGTPVVAFRIGVATDLIQHGVTGFIADTIDPEALAGAISSFIMLDLTNRSKMSTACRNLAESLCTQAVQVNKIVEIALIEQARFAGAN